MLVIAVFTGNMMDSFCFTLYLFGEYVSDFSIMNMNFYMILFIYWTNINGAPSMCLLYAKCEIHSKDLYLELKLFPPSGTDSQRTLIHVELIDTY